MQSATQLHPIWRDYPALQPELQQVMQLMTANINIQDADINDAILEMIHGGGKLLRRHTASYSHNLQQLIGNGWWP